MCCCKSRPREFDSAAFQTGLRTWKPTAREGKTRGLAWVIGRRIKEGGLGGRDMRVAVWRCWVYVSSSFFCSRDLFLYYDSSVVFCWHFMLSCCCKRHARVKLYTLVLGIFNFFTLSKRSMIISDVAAMNLLSHFFY